ncbi:acetyl-CoA C-acetyltransferase [Georgenia soli]|uniref:Acetyl-CoA C-acetyltransferase n=1 Tax=Georgenia soli TaxID=638953 RepID=A0A2A9EKJ2_9MICO|nr:thiolase family protein [Georgenia soli]PFG39051.1 acetyl-CoA C-acetyltransferase [Georgenia soli]
MSKDRIVIVDGARTPTGSFGGALAAVPNHELGAHAVKAACARAGVAVEDVDEFVIGCVGQVGGDAFIGRRVSLAAGARPESTAMAVNRLCGSGLQAIATAAQELLVGEAKVAVAGGTENMSRQPFMDFDARNGWKLGHHNLVDGTLSLVTDPWGNYPMGMTAENVAERYGITREMQDEFAVESQRRAQVAIAEGTVKGEIEPITISERKGDRVVDTDEHPRAGVTVERLAKMRPAFKKDGSVTAGNSSGINDAGSAVVVTTAAEAERRGLKPRAELVDFTKAGVDPEIMGYAPKVAIEKLLDRQGMSAADIGWIELNEAFAAQAVAVIRDAGLDPEKVNPLGGAIAWGHPIGATGGILTVRLIEALHRNNLEHGLVSMCIGGGQAVAALFRAL